MDVKDVLLAKKLSGSGGGGGGTLDHSKLVNRDKADQHPIKAITGLQNALDTINRALSTKANWTTTTTMSTSSVQLANNRIYRADKLASIAFTLPALKMDSVYDTEIDVTIGATPMQVTAPAGIDWMGDDVESGAWVPTENKRYVLYIYWDGVRYRAISQSQKIGG